MRFESLRIAATGFALAVAAGVSPASAEPIAGGFSSIGAFINFTLPDRQVPIVSVNELIELKPVFGPGFDPVPTGIYGLRVDNTVNHGSWAAFGFGVTNPIFQLTETTLEGWNSTTLNLANPGSPGSGFVNDSGDQVFFLRQDGLRVNYQNLVQVVDENGFMNFYWTNDAGSVLGAPNLNVFRDDFSFLPVNLASDFVVFLIDLDSPQETPILAVVWGTAQTAVPEPASALLLLGGLGVLRAFRRRLR